MKLEGGLGADTFVLSNRAGGTATTDFTAILDFQPGEGDTISLAGNLQASDVEILDVTSSDLSLLNNAYDPYRTSASIGDSFIRSKTTGEILAVIKSTSSSSVSISGNVTSSLSAPEQQLIAPQSGGKITVENFNTSSPGYGVRIIEHADLANSNASAYYLSSAAYSTLAGGKDTFNKFASFDFTDPPAPYSTFLNGRVGPLQHTHNNELETFFVVAGNYIFTDGEQTGVNSGTLKDVEVGPGTLVVGPQGFVHGFRAKEDDGPARIFSWALPAGLETFFQNSGTRVSNRYTHIVPNNAEEAANTAFWAGQRGDSLFLTPWDQEQAFSPTGSWANLRPEYTGRALDGRAIATKSATWPKMMAPSITSADRPLIANRFGEQRLSLVNSDEAGDVTGKVAWKGPLGPKQPGGTFSYDALTFRAGTNSDYKRSAVVAESPVPRDPQDPTPSSFDIIYTLSDGLSLRLLDQVDPTNPGAGNNPTYELDALTFVQLPAGTRYALANTGDSTAQALNIHTFNSPNATKPSITAKRNLLSIDGNPTFSPLNIRLKSPGNDVGGLTQVAVVSTDERGRLLPESTGGHANHGGTKPLKPSDPGFKLEALKQAKLVTTLINNRSLQPAGSLSTISNFESDNLLFLTVKGSTIADTIRKAENKGSSALRNVRVGADAVTLRQTKSGAIAIKGKAGNNFELSLKAGNQFPDVYGTDYRSKSDVPIGRFNWNLEENDLGLLDLTYSTDQYSDINSGRLDGASIAVDSITGFSNVSGSASDQQRIIGFYQIQDENGTIFDPVTQSMLAPTRENKASYINAVLANANSPSKGFSQPGTEGRLRTFLEGGYLYAPFVQTLTRNGLELYLPFPAVSSDSYQHAVPLANNTWGFNSSPDPGRRNQFDSSMALSFDVPPPFVVPPA